MTRARRRHPALARKIDAMTVPTTTPGIGIAIIDSSAIAATLSPEREALVNLIEETRESAEWRGHSELHDRFISDTQARITCGVCGMEADAQTNPPANGIDIGGELVALNCKETN